MLGEAVFGTTRSGGRSSAAPTVIVGTPAADDRALPRARYRPANVVIAAAGGHRPRRARGAGAERCARRPPTATGRRRRRRHHAAGAAAARRRFERKDTEQYHVCLGGPGLLAPRRPALRAARAGHDLRRLDARRACSRRCARSAASRTPCTRSPSQYSDTGQVGAVRRHARRQPRQGAGGGRRPSSQRFRAEPVTAEELHRAKENLKGRLVLALESTGGAHEPARLARSWPTRRCCRSTRWSSASTRSTLEDLVALADELWRPRAPVGGRHRPRRASASTRRSAPGAGREPSPGGGRSLIRVAVAGAAGRMGATVCRAVEGAEDMELVARADPALGNDAGRRARRRRRAGGLHRSRRPRWPTRARRRAPASTWSIGTTGFDVSSCEDAARREGQRASWRPTSRSARC